MILSTVLRPTSGTVLFGLVDISRNPQAARNQLGVAFQEPVLDGRLTVEQNLEFHADACHLGRTDKKNRIKEVLTYLDMWDTRKERASNLSGGMKKKIEDAKVFIQKPLIAIFDEPTAYLDVPSRHRVWKRILSLTDEGATVIRATNMMDEADNLCDRVAILSKGRLITVGSPSTLKDAIPKGDVVEMELAENAQLVKDRVEMMPFVRQVLILKPSQ